MEDETKSKVREYLHWAAALKRSMEATLQREDPSNVWKHSGYKQFARKYNQILSEMGNNIQLPPILDRYNIEAMPGSGKTIAYQQKEIFEGVYANVSILCGLLEGKLGIVESETKALRDFLQSKVRSAMLHIPNSEREVQDVIEQLLIGRGLQKGQDYDREVGRVKVSAKEVVPDFIVQALSMAVEVKLIKTAARVKEVVDEINADVLSYSKQYVTLLFVVYDMGQIRDEVEFRHDLESREGVTVLVIKQ